MGGANPFSPECNIDSYDPAQHDCAPERHCAPERYCAREYHSTTLGWFSTLR